MVVLGIESRTVHVLICFFFFWLLLFVGAGRVQGSLLVAPRGTTEGARDRIWVGCTQDKHPTYFTNSLALERLFFNH